MNLIKKIKIEILNIYQKKKNRNKLYRNYLREKRSKSLEKSFSKSFSKANDLIIKTDSRNIFSKNNYLKKIRLKADDYNDFRDNSFNEDNNMDDSRSSFHEDLPIKYPIRIDKNLVKRKSPHRKNFVQNRLKFCYENHFEDLKINNQTNNRIEKEQYYLNYFNNPIHYNLKKINNFNDKQNMINFESEMDMPYNEEILYQEGQFEGSKFSSNNLDLKIFQEDITSHIDNGRY